MLIMRCLVMDDEPIARKIIREYIEETDYLVLVGEAENPMRAMQVLNDEVVNIIFLDINMPKMNGIDFLKNTHTKASIIMTTAYHEHAVQAYELDVLDYLVKPISFERFIKACNKAFALQKQKIIPGEQHNLIQDHFFVKCNNQIEKVWYKDLVYAEAMLNYVMLYTHAKKIMVYVTIKSLEEQLPASMFIKVHKSFIVNIDKVKSIDGNVLDVGETKITISQNLREKVIGEIVKDKMIRR